LKQKVLPELLKEYEVGKIGAKKVMQLLQISPDEFLQAVHEFNIQCPITPDLDDYTENVLNRILETMKSQ
jgi:hypothetical protein